MLSVVPVPFDLSELPVVPLLLPLPLSASLLPFSDLPVSVVVLSALAFFSVVTFSVVVFSVVLSSVFFSVVVSVEESSVLLSCC